MIRLGVFSRFSLAALTLAICSLVAVVATASDLTTYKDLHNDFVKVTDVRERQRTEERYVPSGNQVTLQKVPYKEVVVTAELRRKPPASMDAFFSGTEGQPLLKVCMIRFDAAGQRLEDSCQALKFESMVKGNVGTTIFRLPDDTARYELHMAEAKGDKGSAIKLWYPTN